MMRSSGDRSVDDSTINRWVLKYAKRTGQTHPSSSQANERLSREWTKLTEKYAKKKAPFFRWGMNFDSATLVAVIFTYMGN